MRASALEILSLALAALRQADSLDSIASAILGSADHMGLTGVAIIDPLEVGRGPTAYGMSQAILAEIGAPAPWAAYRDDLQKAASTDLPFRSAAAVADVVGSPIQYRIVIPVRERGLLTWLVCLSGEQPQVSTSSQMLLGAVAHAAYARYRAMQDEVGGRSKGLLTKREAACLEMVSQGKSDAEAARLLQISARTVRFHMQNAQRKLGASTRIQAVAKRTASFNAAAPSPQAEK